MLPDRVVGASIGAICGALIAGSPPERRLDTLRAFWRPGAEAPVAPWFAREWETARRTAAVTAGVLAGRSGLYGPILSALMPYAEDRPSIFENEQLPATLARLIDVDRLNDGGCRFIATAVDLETGDDVEFDTATRRVEVAHLRASASLPVAFAPVEIDGRWLVDGGLSANLPLDPVLAEPPPHPVLCVAVDLLPLAQPRPTSIGEAASRVQDLIFAAQSRRTIARWQQFHGGRRDISVVVARLAYTDQHAEVAGKAFDFSPATIAQRWAAGYAAGRRFTDRHAAGEVPVGAPGVTVLD